MRQEAGGRALEAGKIARHATLNITGNYTAVQLKQQDELTRAIQDRVTKSPEKQDTGDERAGKRECRTSPTTTIRPKALCRIRILLPFPF